MAKLKRAVSCLLAAVMLLGMCMLVPAASAAETADGLVYEETEEGIIITGYVGVGGDVVIPEEINSKAVIGIQKYAFRVSEVPAADNITSIVIPDSVTSIAGTGLFRGCSQLRSVTFPENAVIDSTASMFRDCTALESITIPKSCTEIGNAMFVNRGSFPRWDYNITNRLIGISKNRNK